MVLFLAILCSCPRCLTDDTRCAALLAERRSRFAEFSAFPNVSIHEIMDVVYDILHGHRVLLSLERPRFASSSGASPFKNI